MVLYSSAVVCLHGLCTALNTDAVWLQSIYTSQLLEGRVGILGKEICLILDTKIYL